MKNGHSDGERSPQDWRGEAAYWLRRLHVLQNEGQLDALREAIREAQSALPECAPWQCCVGWLLRQQGELHAAKAALSTALRLEPTLVLAHVRLGVVCRDLGRLQEAEQATRRALQLDPLSAGSWMNLAVILKDACRLHEASVAIDRALELEPSLPGGGLNKASILRDLAEPEAALQVLSVAKVIEGESASLLALEGALLQTQGRLTDAEKKLRRALELDPLCSQAYLALIQQYGSNKDSSLDQALQQALMQPRLSTAARCDILFARAKLDHNFGRFREAAEALHQANQLKQFLRPSNAVSVLDQGERLWSQFYIAAESYQPEHNGPGLGCVFVVGMPRSGSTLVETILSMKEDCIPLGEVDWFPQAYRQVEGVLDETQRYPRLSEYYLRARAARQACADGWSIDKQLSNYQFCGHIILALPQAKVIYSRRHPLDVLLSIYKSNFSVGLGYASSLVDSARILAQQEHLMQKYKMLFPDHIRVCDYEALVCDPAKEVARLVDWLGWEWDENYLKSHQNSRSISTASVIQARLPIHSESVDSWKHYEDLLEPARLELNRLGVHV